MQEADWANERGLQPENCGPLRPCRLRLRARHKPDAGTGEHEGHDCLPLGDLNGNDRLESDGGEGGLYHPPTRGTRWGEHEGQASKVDDADDARPGVAPGSRIFSPNWYRLGLKECRLGDRHQLLIGQGQLDQARDRGGQLGEPHLGTPTPHQFGNAAATPGVVGLDDPHNHSRMGGDEAADEVGEGIDGQRRQGGDVESAALEPGDVSGGGPQRDDVPKHQPGVIDHDLAGGRQAGAAPDTVEQVDAELPLQVADPRR